MGVRDHRHFNSLLDKTKTRQTVDRNGVYCCVVLHSYSNNMRIGKCSEIKIEQIQTGVPKRSIPFEIFL